MFYVSGANPAFTMADCLAHGWAPVFTCMSDTCPDRSTGRRHRVVWGEEELRAQPAGVTLGDLAARAVCSTCNGRDGHVSTINGGWLRTL